MAIQLQSPHDSHKNARFGHCHSPRTTRKTRRRRRLVVGAKHIKKIAKPILERSAKEKKQKEDEGAKKKQEAITAMWGGLWANDGYTALSYSRDGPFSSFDAYPFDSDNLKIYQH